MGAIMTSNKPPSGGTIREHTRPMTTHTPPWGPGPKPELGRCGDLNTPAGEWWLTATPPTGAVMTDMYSPADGDQSTLL